MKNLQYEVGKRLREIRGLFNHGFKASVEQFASELGENKANISNYENGKANVPPRLLVALFEKGFNPVYILTGTGNIFSDNEQGSLRDKSSSKAESGEAEIIGNLNIKALSVNELNQKAGEYLAVAGDILRIIREKNSEDEK